MRGGANPNPGRVALHRLNRAEYANAIEDLLGMRIDAAALLPKDDEADGFDNVASVLTVSPSFLDQYISAARVVTARALGNPAAGRAARPIVRRAGPIRPCASRAAARHARRTAGRASVPGRRRLQASTSAVSPPPATCAAWSIATRSSSPSTASRCSRARSAARRTSRRSISSRPARGGDQRPLPEHPGEGHRRPAQVA